MTKTISVERDGLVTTFSIKLLIIESINEFMDRYPGRSSGDLQTAKIANDILIELLLKK